MNVLYTGELDSEGRGTCTQRMWAIQELGHEVDGVGFDYPSSRIAQLPMSLRRRLTGRMGSARLLRKLTERLRSKSYDLFWIDKGCPVPPDALRAARTFHPHIRCVGYSPDDMLNPGNQSREFFESLPLYDVFFTTKSFHVAELASRGCPRVVFIGNAYQPTVHRPVELTDAERRELGGPVGFIGYPERERAERMARLAAAGIPVKIWGSNWTAWKRRLGASFEVAGPGQFADAYAKVLCAFDINLCFLRKANRDLQTTRSIEIPACGAFMLGERTQEHVELFEEGREAEFFDGDDELFRKARYYLEHPDERLRIAAAGRERCLRSGYSNRERMRTMLKTVFENSPPQNP